MSTTQLSLPLSHFYRETLGSEYLSQNLASNELLTPLQLDRVTVSPSRFEKYRASLEKQPRLPWGRLRDYGGLQKVQLPEEFIKPRTYPPAVVQKGHRHYGTGASDQRDLKVEQYFDLTHLNKSHVRTSDQVLPPPPHKEMNKRQIDLPFPAEHPYTSHISRLAVFPKFNSPDDPNIGDPARSKQPLHPNGPATGNKVLIKNKAKGSPYRRELQEYPHESEKQALTWPGENDFYQLKKSPEGGKQPYFPTPPKIVHPNLRMRDENQRLELRSVNSLRNLERDQWTTSYDYNFTGNGPSNALHLDDYHQKMVDEITSGRDSRNDSMRPATSPTFVSPRPREGRYGRLYQNRGHITADIRYPDDDPKPDPVDVMDTKEYKSYPDLPKPSRSKDEWYSTGRQTADPTLWKNGEKEVENRKLKSASSARHVFQDEEVEEWRRIENQSQPEEGLEKVKANRNLLGENDFSELPKTIEEQIQLPEKQEHYLEQYQQARDDKFKDFERRHEENKLALQYIAHNDMHALRNKTDQMGNRLEPKALDQHSIQASQDGQRLVDLRTKSHETPERYNTGLKFSTETISDRGTLTYLHDRQLDGYKDFPKTWRRDIPTVDPPQQNRKGELSSYVTRTNPFSLSVDSGAEVLASRSGDTARLSASASGSILRVPGSPPRTGESKSISFNEVVRVASSEYGARFQVSTSPLTDPKYNSKRPSTPFPSAPLPSPPRSISEPSLYDGLSPRGPSLRPSSAYPHESTRPPTRDNWAWNHDVRMKAQFDPKAWLPEPGSPRPQSALLDIQNSWSKSDAYKRFHESLPENAPDMRNNERHYELADKSADLRFHHSIKHREKRHKFYGFNSYHFYNGNPIL